MTAALEGGEWSAARPGRTLPPGKTRYPFYRRLGGPQGRSGRAENLVPTGIRSWTVQPVASQYTDWATRPTNVCSSFMFMVIVVQRSATQSSLCIILQVHSTRFGCQKHISSGVHKTVTTASGTGHVFCAPTSLQRGQASLATLEYGRLQLQFCVLLMMGVVDTRNIYSELAE